MSWWQRLTRGAQKKYLKEHPDSIYSKQVKAEKKSSAEPADIKIGVYQNRLIHLQHRMRKMNAKANPIKYANLLAEIAKVRKAMKEMR